MSEPRVAFTLGLVVDSRAAGFHPGDSRECPDKIIMCAPRPELLRILVEDMRVAPLDGEDVEAVLRKLVAQPTINPTLKS